MRAWGVGRLQRRVRVAVIDKGTWQRGRIKVVLGQGSGKLADGGEAHAQNAEAVANSKACQGRE
jgi:hypothetical protein